MKERKRRIKRLLLDFLLEIVGVVVLFFVLYEVQTTRSINQQKENSNAKLDVVEQRIKTNIADASEELARYDAFSQAKIDTLAYYYDKTPDDISNQKGFTKMAKQWGLSELYIIDEAGKVVADSKNSGTTSFDDNEQLCTVIESQKPDTIDTFRYYASKMENGRIILGARDFSKMKKEQDYLLSLDYVLHNIKIGSHGYVVAVDINNNTVLYHPLDNLIGKTISEAGIDSNVMVDGYEGWVTNRGNKYYCESRAYEGKYQFVAVRPKDMIDSSNIKLILLAIIVFVLVVNVIIIYMHFIRLEEDEKTDEERSSIEYLKIGKLHFNKSMASKVWHVIIAAVIIIFGISFYIQTLALLSQRAAKSAEKLEDVDALLEVNRQSLNELTNEYTDEYEQRANNIAYILGKNHSLVDNDILAEIATRAQIKYIYVYDKDGKVDATNGIFQDLELSTDTSDKSFEFWNVIKGYQDTIIQAARKDETDEKSYIQYIGTRRRDKNGLVQVGISPKRLKNRLKTVQTSHVLPVIAVENRGFMMSINKETKKFIYFPDSNNIGCVSTDYGMTESAFVDNYVGYQTINHEKFFVSGIEYDKEYIYVVVPVSAISEGRTEMSLIVMGMSVLLLMIIAICSLIGKPVIVEMNQQQEEATEPLEEPRGMIEIVTGTGEVKRVQSVIGRWGKKSREDNKNAEQKLKGVLSIIVGLVAVILVYYLFSQNGTYDKESIISYISNKKWEKNISVFSISYIGMVLIEVLVVSAIARKCIFVIVENLGARAETIGRLLNNFIKYMSVIGALFYSLNFIGVDTSTVLASAGLLTLIVGLGAQQLVGDILAGVFIVFEGEFRVGDIITLGDLRGTVLEIGIRSTKIEDFGQNVKIINNSNISGVVNMTRKYSFAFCDIGIEYNESLERVENVLNKELPLVKKRIPTIEAGPFYRGVGSLDDSAVTLKIIAQCKEIDRVQLTRDLNREMKLIFDRNNINIPFPQVVINEPSEKVEVSRYEKWEAQKFVDEQKELTKELGDTVSNN